jgi:hypothetical protein
MQTGWENGETVAIRDDTPLSTLIDRDAFPGLPEPGSRSSRDCCTASVAFRPNGRGPSSGDRLDAPAAVQRCAASLGVGRDRDRAATLTPGDRA